MPVLAWICDAVSAVMLLLPHSALASCARCLGFAVLLLRGEHACVFSHITSVCEREHTQHIHDDGAARVNGRLRVVHGTEVRDRGTGAGMANILRLGVCVRVYTCVYSVPKSSGRNML